MTNERFTKQRLIATTDRFDMCDAKSVEYTRASGDRLANFKRIGREMDVPPRLILGVYLHKHTDSILHYINSGDGGVEGIHSRIADAQNYLDLLDALVTEETINEAAQAYGEDAEAEPCQCGHCSTLPDIDLSRKEGDE